MRARCVETPRVFSIPKAGNTAEENEDAAADNTERTIQGRIHVAVADGATESAFSRQWAAALARHFAMAPPGTRLNQPWLSPIRREFARTIDIASLPWHAQEKAGRGAFATLLGLTVDLSKGWYRVLAVGDSCLAVIPDGSGRATPVVVPKQFADPRAFGSTPYLIGSNPTYNAQLQTAQIAMDEPRALRAGLTTFLLMTDALGAWFARARQRGGRPWEDLAAIPGVSQFADFVTDLRRQEVIRNDDVTLVRLAVERPRGR